MKVTDLNGCPIEVTDLDEAIGITAQYKAYRHEEKRYSDFDKNYVPIGRICTRS